jgi:hypothetical protein
MAVGKPGRVPSGPAFRGGDTMAIDQMIQKVQDALKLGKLKSKLPPNPKVVDICVEDYVDSDGEDALRVTIVIDEDVDVEKVSGQDLSDLVDAIRSRIRELDVERWAYIGFAKPSELEEDEDEE